MGYKKRKRQLPYEQELKEIIEEAIILMKKYEYIKNNNDNKIDDDDGKDV